MFRPSFVALAWLISVQGFASIPYSRRATQVRTANGPLSEESSTSTSLSASLTIYGSQGSRSPLINWAAYELGLDFQMGDLSQNPHPFGQIPCLKDGDTIVFESGAILLYLNSLLPNDAATQGDIFSWVAWANASLDPICFLETPDGKVYDTGLKNTSNKRIRKLDIILSERDFLVGDELTVADVAIASYLLYVVQFFPDINLSTWPHIVQYLQRCASREAYGKAYGANVQGYLMQKLQAMGQEEGAKKKLFGMF